MTNASRLLTATVITAVLTATLLVAQAPTAAQTPAATAAAEKDKALKAERIAEQLATQARVLTIFDRQGKVVTTVGERGLYTWPVFSPDRTRLAVMKRDLANETVDLWVIDVNTGKTTRITNNQWDEGGQGETSRMTPVWSPDGRQLAYPALRSGYFGLYRKASNGQGTEELLYQHPGGEINLRDWSLDGRFLSFSVDDAVLGAAFYALPLRGRGVGKPIELLRSKGGLWGPSFSPDSRFLSYGSDESGRYEIYVRPFNPSVGAATTAAAGPWQVSNKGGFSSGYWRRDGKEIYYLSPDGIAVVVVKAGTAPTGKFQEPKMLFRLPAGAPANSMGTNVSRDGQRIVIAVPPAPVSQQMTLFDRQGNVLSRVGSPGNYGGLALSPDGTRVAVQMNGAIWTFDVASGNSTRVANGYAPIWSPDGTQVAYVRQLGNFRRIYHKAADGSGDEEYFFQYTAGANMILTDWSQDGKFLTFYPGSCGFLIFVVPLAGQQNGAEREAIEWLRDEYDVFDGRLSPDSRFMAYLSNEGKTKEEVNSGISEVYVRPFDPAQSDVSKDGQRPVRVSAAGASGGIFWRQDGKELYYLTPAWEVMAVDVTSTPTFQAGSPRMLFKLPGRPAGNPEQWKNVSADGQRFVFHINVPASMSAR